MVAVLIAIHALAPSIAAALTRAGLPFADNLWSEGPLLLQLHRMAIGEPWYTPTTAVNSFTYGPLYLLTLRWIERALSLPLDPGGLRRISIALSLLSTIPLAICALLIALRAGIGSKQRLAQSAVAITALLFGAAVVTQSLAFEALHPNALLFLCVECALALYYAIEGGLLPQRCIWFVALACLLAAFTDQNSSPLFPILVFGLVATRAVPFRAGAVAALSFVLVVAALYLAMPADARAWTLLVPRSQGYGLSLPAFAGFWTNLWAWQPHLLTLAVATCVTMALLWRRNGLRSLPTDVAPLLAVLVTALGGFFRQAGTGSNLTLLGLFAVAYYAVLAGMLVTWSVATGRRTAAGIVAALIVVAVPLTTYFPARQIPDATMLGQLRQAQTVATELCARHEAILVTVFPEMFFDCPTARFALTVSFGQLVAAYPRYYVGQTPLDVAPVTPYVVSVDFYGMPVPLPGWLKDYHIIRKVPAPFGYASTFYWPSNMLVYARNTGGAR